MDFGGIAQIVLASATLLTALGSVIGVIITARRTEAVKAEVVEVRTAQVETHKAFNSKMDEALEVMRELSLKKGAEQEGARRDALDAARAEGARGESDRLLRTAQAHAEPLAPKPAAPGEQPVPVEDEKVADEVRKLGVKQERVENAVDDLATGKRPP